MASLSQQYGSVIVLEDDLYVSPHFYTYTVQALNYYGDDPQIAGIALYSPRISGIAKKMPFFPMQDGADVFFSQMVCSWGQAWSAKQWAPFKAWLDGGQEVRAGDQLPHSIKRWKDHSWVKIFSKYVVEAHRFFVYPYVSYTTNMGDAGVHFQRHEPEFQVSLQMGRPKPRFHHIDDAKAVYDVCFDLLPSRLNALQPALAEYQYVVDLFGIKDLDTHPEKWVLTQQPVSRSAKSWGRALIPWEMNIIQDIPGQEIHLARKEDIRPQSRRKASVYSYYYSSIPLRPLLFLAWNKLKQKKPFSYFFKK